MLEFRHKDVSCRQASFRQANQDVAASQPFLMTAKPLPQHTLRAIAIDCARKDTLRNDKAQSADADSVGVEHHAKAGTLDGLRSR